MVDIANQYDTISNILISNIPKGDNMTADIRKTDNLYFSIMCGLSL